MDEKNASDSASVIYALGAFALLAALAFGVVRMAVAYGDAVTTWADAYSLATATSATIRLHEAYNPPTECESATKILGSATIGIVRGFSSSGGYTDAFSN